MRVSDKAAAAIKNLFKTFNNNGEMFLNELQDCGICLECGEVAHGVEPDASGYNCEACSLNRVEGIENIVLFHQVL